MSGTVEKSSKIVTYALLQPIDVRVSKIGTYAVIQPKDVRATKLVSYVAMKQVDLRVRKLVSYIVLGVSVAPPTSTQKFMSVGLI